METVITWKCCTALRATECDLLSDGGELELIDSRCRRVSDILYIHVHVGATYTPEWATHHSATCHNHHLRPDFSTSGAHVMCCHQPQRGTRSLFFKNSDLVFTLSLLHQLFRDCLHTSLSLRIHHAWIHSCSHRCSSTWVCNMHSRTELTWERLNIACSLS